MSNMVKQLGTLMDAVLATADASARTVEIAFEDNHGNSVRSAEVIRFTAILDYTAATALAFAAYTSLNGGDNWGRVEASNLAASGVGTLVDYVPTKASGSGDLSIDLQFDVRCCTHFKITLTATGGGASDKLSLIGAALQER